MQIDPGGNGEKFSRDWTDDEPFGNGFFSIRLMAAAKGWYDDYEVYELREDPFADSENDPDRED